MASWKIILSLVKNPIDNRVLKEYNRKHRSKTNYGNASIQL
jgi:hypothetical protein